MSANLDLDTIIRTLRHGSSLRDGAASPAEPITSHAVESSPMPKVDMTRSDILAVGGAEDKENDKVILWEFFRRAGGSEAVIVIIPSASGIPDVLGTLYQDIFVGMGAPRDHVSVLDIRTPVDARQSKALETLKDATAVYFTGGDQERLSDVLADTELMESIRLRSRSGSLVVGGTSAGASALGHHMISRGYSGESPTPAIVTVKTGLGLLPTMIVDQHFHQRNRLVRLITAVAYHPHCLGLGIDENTAAIIQADQTLTVIGVGSVTLVDGSQMTSTVEHTSEDDLFNLSDARVHFLATGSRFDLTRMKPL